jgi:hypothetical protein
MNTTFEQWIETGIKNNWCSEIVCWLHDGPPLTPDEQSQQDSGGDPCVYIARINDPQKP